MNDIATVTFVCAACGAPLTNAITQLPSVPETPYQETFDDDAATMPAGYWAIDPSPQHSTIHDGDYSDPDNPFRDGSHEQLVMNSPLLNPVDLLDLPPHPDPRRNYGCCRRDGFNGPNLVCPSCGAEVATIQDDCQGLNEVRLLPSAVGTVPAQ